MSLDGAAYMRSEYVGESAYVWCCSHVLNVCMCDGTESIREARNLYGVLIHLAVFFGVSCKRVLPYENFVAKHKVGHQKLHLLLKLGTTSWGSKKTAILPIYGSVLVNNY